MINIERRSQRAPMSSNSTLVSLLGDISSCKRFAAFLERSPHRATLEDIRRFQLHLDETGASISNRNSTMTGLRVLVGTLIQIK